MRIALQRSRRPRVEDLERVPQLQQRLRAYAAANSAPAPASDQQLQANYNQKMKELLAIEEDLRRQEAALMAREKKLKGAMCLGAACRFVAWFSLCSLCFFYTQNWRSTTCAARVS